MATNINSVTSNMTMTRAGNMGRLLMGRFRSFPAEDNPATRRL